jgi:hypothetical protein
MESGMTDLCCADRPDQLDQAVTWLVQLHHQRSRMPGRVALNTLLTLDALEYAIS